MMKIKAIVSPIEPPMRLRKAFVQLDGESVGFWLDADDHPEVCPGSEVMVDLDPQDQYARIVG